MIDKKLILALAMASVLNCFNVDAMAPIGEQQLMGMHSNFVNSKALNSAVIDEIAFSNPTAETINVGENVYALDGVHSGIFDQFPNLSLRSCLCFFDSLKACQLGIFTENLLNTVLPEEFADFANNYEHQGATYRDWLIKANKDTVVFFLNLDHGYTLYVIQNINGGRLARMQDYFRFHYVSYAKSFGLYNDVFDQLIPNEITRDNPGANGMTWGDYFNFMKHAYECEFEKLNF